MKKGFDTRRVADNIDNTYSQARGKSAAASRRKVKPDVMSTKETFSKQHCILKGYRSRAISRGVFRTLLNIYDRILLLLAVNYFLKKAGTQMLDRILSKALTKYGFDYAICYIT